jgi:hypothetical protein
LEVYDGLSGEGGFASSAREGILGLVRLIKDDYAIGTKPALDLVNSFLSRFGCGD